MKKQLLKLLTITVITAIGTMTVVSSCKKENPNARLGSIEVKLTLKEGLGNFPLESIEVILQNSTGTIEKSALSNAVGEVSYIAIPAGTYSISVSHYNERERFSLTGNVNSVIVTIGNQTDVIVELNAVVTNSTLLFKEVKATGADDQNHSLHNDQFLEIFNNSSETIYLDGIYIGNTFGTYSKIMVRPYSQDLDLENFVYLTQIFQFPGSGTDYPIAPSQSVLFAYNAINFKQGSPAPEKSLDLSGADFDIYAVDWLEMRGRLANPSFDLQNTNVTDCIPIFLYEGMQNWFGLDLFSSGVVMLRSQTTFSDSDNGYLYQHSTTNGDSEVYLMKVPVENVIDGMEYLEDASITNMKTLPASIDASYIYISAQGGAHLSGKSFRRKIDQVATQRFGRTILQDSNDTALDFEVINMADPRGYDPR
ncbi:MAG: DUF4876 domain-containing protein [Bacteroidales bacterium]